jgi:hypothetical protein
MSPRQYPLFPVFQQFPQYYGFRNIMSGVRKIMSCFSYYVHGFRNIMSGFRNICNVSAVQGVFGGLLYHAGSLRGGPNPFSFFYNECSTPARRHGDLAYVTPPRRVPEYSIWLYVLFVVLSGSQLQLTRLRSPFPLVSVSGYFFCSLTPFAQWPY